MHIMSLVPQVKTEEDVEVDFDKVSAKQASSPSSQVKVPRLPDVLVASGQGASNITSGGHA